MSVMDDIRAEAKRRGDARAAKQASLRDLDSPTAASPAQQIAQEPSAHSQKPADMSPADPVNPAGVRTMAPGNVPAYGSGHKSVPTYGGAELASASHGVTDGASETYPLLEGTGVSMEMCGPTTANPCMQLLAMAGLRLPSDASFLPFFRDWFEQEHFPKMSQRLQQELKRRAQNKGLFAGIASQVRGIVMANTDASLQADVWHHYFMRHNPPQYGNYCVGRTATINLGSVAQPCWVTFIGTPGQEDTWHPPLLGAGEPDYGALLDELDGRGGMEAALLAAAS